MKSRVITGAAYALTIIACIFLGKWGLLLLTSAFMVRCMFEMYRAIRSSGIEPVRWAGYTFCGLVICAQVVELLTRSRMNLSLFSLVIGMMAAMIRLIMHGTIAVDSMMATVFPMLYPGAFFLLLMDLFTVKVPFLVPLAAILVFFTPSVYDSCALFSGMLFGKHKLAPLLSPKKTIEGAVGGVICSTLFGMATPAIARFIFAYLDPSSVTLPPIWAFGILGALAGVLSQMGDLTASMIKRHFGVKDYGTLLPGHGGIMDRLDGILFCVPAVFIFFRLFNLV